MIGQLLQIRSQHLRLEMSSSFAQLRYNQGPNPQIKMTRVPSSMEIKSENIEVRLDGTVLRASLGQRTMDAFAREAGRRGREGAQKATAAIVQEGNQLAKIEDGVTVGQIARQKALEQPDTYTFFLPEPYKMTWKPNQQTISYDPGSVRSEWQIEKMKMEYVPASLSVRIAQWPKATITYIGGPTYFPPSAAPGR